MDDQGNVYIIGLTASSDFPVTPGAYDEVRNGQDVFIARLDSSLSTLMAATFLGGANAERGLAIVVDGTGNVFVTGETSSSDFPTTPGAFSGSYGGGVRDAFVAKLDATLSTLMASTFLGGSSAETPYAIGLDGSGGVFVAGYTASSNFPTTPGAFRNTLNGNTDAFLSRLDGALSTLVASTFLGGSDNDDGKAVHVDSGGVYLAGFTNSADLPVPVTGYDGTYNGDPADGFIIRMNGTLDSLTGGTYLGGTGYDIIYALDGDETGGIVAGGYTASSDFPTTPGALDQVLDGNGAFVSRLDGDLTTLLAGTFLDGSAWDEVRTLRVDTTGKIFVGGFTTSPDFPIVTGAYDTTHAGTGEDGFVSILVLTLDSLAASTFLGGEMDNDRVLTLGVGTGGRVFVAGVTTSSDFPVVPGAMDTTCGGCPNSMDVFVSSFQGSPIRVAEPVPDLARPFSVGPASITFALTEPAYVGVTVFSPEGRRLHRISVGFVGSGRREISLKALNPGVYVLRVRIGSDVHRVRWVRLP